MSNKITKADRMFKNTTSINSIDVSELKGIETATNMFEGCDAPNINWGSMKPSNSTDAFLDYYINSDSSPTLNINVDDMETSGYIEENSENMKLADLYMNYNGYNITGYEVPRSSKVKYTDLKRFILALSFKAMDHMDYPEYDIEIDTTGAPESYFKGTMETPSQLAQDLLIDTEYALLNITITIPDDVTNIDYAFSRLSCLKSLNIKGGKNVVSAEGMLMNSMLPGYGSSKILIKGANEFTSLINASGMFCNCEFEGLTSGFEKVENASYMFGNCYIKNIDFSLFKNVIDASYMFGNCDVLDVTIPESAFTKTTNASYMFSEIYDDNANIVINGMNSVTNVDNMFNSTSSGNIIINGMNGVITASNMFSGVGRNSYSSKKVNITINGLNGATDVSFLFVDSGEINITFTNSFSNVENASNMFDFDIDNLVDLTPMKKLTTTDNMFAYTLSEIKFDGFINLTSFQNMFNAVGPAGLHIITSLENQTWINQNKTTLGLDGYLYFFEDEWENVVLDYATMDTQLSQLDPSKRYSFTFTGLEDAEPSFFNGGLSYQIDNYGLIYKIILSVPDTITDLSNCFYNSNILQLDIIKANNVTNIDNLFYNSYNIKTFDCKNLNKVTSVDSFISSSSLREVDVSGLTSLKNANNMFSEMYEGITIVGLDKIGKNLTDTSYMFSNSIVNNMKTIDMNIMFPNTENISGMFSICKGIEEVSVDSSKIKAADTAFNDSSIKKATIKMPLVKDVSNMFSDAIDLESVILDLPNVEIAESLFAGTPLLTNVDISSMKNIKNTSSMFNRSGIKTVICGSIKPISAQRMFSGTNIETFDCSIFENTEYASEIFDRCLNLKTVSNVVLKKCIDASGMFAGSGIENFIGEIDFSKARAVDNMFYDCINLRKFDLSSFKSAEGFRSFFDGAINIKSVTWNNLSSYVPLETYSMFRNSYNPQKGKIIIKTESKQVMDFVNNSYQEMDLVDMSPEQNPNYEFFDAIVIDTTYDALSSDLAALLVDGKEYKVNVDNSLAPSQGFKGTEDSKSEFNTFMSAAPEKASIKLNFALPNSTNDVSYMLADNKNIISLNIAENQSNTIIADNMLQNCSNLKNVDLIGISGITSAKEMFINCQTLENIDISTLSSLTDVSNMFNGCSSLKIVKWGAIKPTNVTDIFKGTTIKMIRVDSEEMKQWIEERASIMGLTGDYRVIFGTLYDELDTYISSLEPGENDLIIDCTGVTNDQFTYEYGMSPITKKLNKAQEGVLFNIRLVNVEPEVTDLTSAFLNCNSIKSIDLSDVTNIKTAYSMFAYCSKLATVTGTSGFANVTNTSSMFNGCSSLTTVDLSGFANVTNTSSMFNGCSSLTAADLSGFANVTDTSSMFSGCSSLETADCSKLVNVEIAYDMFSECSSLTTVDCSGFVKVTNTDNMFDNCTALEAIDLSGFANVETAYSMFAYCSKLATVTGTSGFTKVTNASYMFNGCSSLTTVDTQYFTKVTDANNMFNGCSSLTAADLSGFTKVTDANNMFNGCSSLTTADLSGFTKVTDANNMFNGCSSLTTVDCSKLVNVEIAYNMFIGCSSLATVTDLSGFTKVINTSNMFNGCSSLTAVDLSGFANVETAYSMFSGCSSLTTVTGTSGFTKVTDVNNMFNGCSSLTAVDLSGFTNIETAYSMFSGCSSIETVDTSCFANVIDARDLFKDCVKLTSVDAQYFTKAVNVNNMFNGCSTLAAIDISMFTNANDTGRMLCNCPALTEINWGSIAPVNNGYMFANSTAKKVITAKDSAARDFIDSNASGMYLYNYIIEGPVSYNKVGDYVSSISEPGTYNLDIDFKGAQETYFTSQTLANSLNRSRGDVYFNIKAYNVDPNITNFSNMLYNCRRIKSINLSEFANVVNADSMFYGCESIESIDISSFTKIQNIRRMLQYCRNLVEINWGSITPTELSGALYGDDLQKTVTVSSIEARAFIKEKSSSMSLSNFTLVGGEVEPGVPVPYRSLEAAVYTFEGDKTYDLTIDTTDAPAEDFNGRTTTSKLVQTLKKAVYNSTIKLTLDIPDTVQDAYGMLQGLGSSPNIISVTIPKATNVNNASFMFGGCSTIKTIDASGLTNTTDASYAFSNCSSLTEIIGLEDLNNVANAEGMFNGCSSLTEINTTGLAKANNIKDIFSGCSSLETVDCSGFTSITDASNMFSDCPALTGITGISGLANVTKTDGMFNNCSSLEAVDTQYFTKVNSILNMFNGCSSLKTVDCSGFTSVTDASNIFDGCVALTEITGISGFANVTNATNMFNNCSSLEAVDTQYFTKVTNVLNMFNGCSALKTVDCSGFTSITDASNMFSGCPALSTVTGLSGFANVVTAENMFKNCTALTSIDTQYFTNVINVRNMFENTGITTIDLQYFTKVTNTSYMFKKCKSLTEITGLAGISGITDANYMFSDCSLLANIDTQHFTNVVNAECMFHGTDITTIDVQYLTKVVNAVGLFLGCKKLTAEGIKNISGLSNVENAQAMFKNCTALTTIDTQYFTKVTNASYMFNGCTALTTIDTQYFTKVTNASYMFNGCTALTAADCSGFTSATHTSYMFNSCSAIKTVTTGVSGFTNVEYADNMFSSCTSLTTIDSMNVFKKLRNADNMFSSCTSLTTIDVSQLFAVGYANYMFSGCTALTTITWMSFQPGNCSHTFSGASAEKNIIVTEFGNIFIADHAREMQLVNYTTSKVA